MTYIVQAMKYATKSLNLRKGLPKALVLRITNWIPVGGGENWVGKLEIVLDFHSLSKTITLIIRYSEVSGTSNLGLQIS
jgi:hypothetical protein